MPRSFGKSHETDFVPSFLVGPYWELAYDENEGYALVSGGQPTEETTDGLCVPGDGINNSGLWIFLALKKEMRL